MGLCVYISIPQFLLLNIISSQNNYEYKIPSKQQTARVWTKIQCFQIAVFCESIKRNYFRNLFPTNNCTIQAVPCCRWSEIGLDHFFLCSFKQFVKKQASTTDCKIILIYQAKRGLAF